MKIEYTYQTEEDRPIRQARFASTEGGRMEISISESYVNLISPGCISSRTFSHADFAEYADLINRINRQINE